MRTWVIERPEQREHFAAFVKRMPLDCPQSITIEDYVPKRSSAQNKHYWALTTEAAKYIGCSAEELHEEMLCQHFGSQEIRMPTGHIRRIPLKRSSGRNVKEFSAYVTFCEAFYACELGVI